MLSVILSVLNTLNAQNNGILTADVPEGKLLKHTNFSNCSSCSYYPFLQTYLCGVQLCGTCLCARYRCNNVAYIIIRALFVLFVQ